ncbi:MAG TPA: AI-2E family transporter [Candidatus Dojkabacteria bacterium]|nr:AI-2E family transporter [Candidatus Dojkabacteria bacterium]HQG57813.1 AI-2E family transporter [Candidatus Dojkabacteria bacterium]
MAKEMQIKMNKNKVSVKESDNTDVVSKKEDAKIVVHDRDNKKEDKVVRIELSTKFILMLIIAVVVFFLWDKLLGVAVVLFFAFIISSAFLPIVRFLTSHKWPKWLAILVVYLLAIILFSASIGVIFVPLINQLINLVNNAPEILKQIVDAVENINLPFVNIDRESIMNAINEYVSNLTSNIIPTLAQGLDGILSTLGKVSEFFGGLLSIVATLFLSIYIISDHDTMLNYFVMRFIKDDQRKLIKALVDNVEEKLGKWLLGQITLSFVIGFLVWLLLTILNVPFALPLAVLAGLLESVPNLGPIIASVPAILFALIGNGPINAVLVVAGYVVIQQFENNLIVPRVMSGAVGIKPIAVLIGIMLGYSIAGVLGALLTVPVLVLGDLFIGFYLDLQKLKAKGIV